MACIIINADDCGITKEVNFFIEELIIKGKISSTTIMANMDDFEGAVRLYKKYKDTISFGWHINLTEGKPLIHSQLLLEEGFYKEIGDNVLFNGESFMRKFINKRMRAEIKKELIAQYEKLCDNGIMITHADSHHHFHTAPSMIFFFPSLFRELNIDRCRHIMNYGVSKLSYMGRQMWTLPYKACGLKMPDTFTSFSTFYYNSSFRHGDIIELECHPGHPKEKYKTEMELISSTDIEGMGARLISYREL